MNSNVCVRGSETKQSWVKPMLQRLDAGSAEVGPNAQRPEGQFASGAS